MKSRLHAWSPLLAPAPGGWKEAQEKGSQTVFVTRGELGGDFASPTPPQTPFLQVDWESERVPAWNQEQGAARVYAGTAGGSGSSKLTGRAVLNVLLYRLPTASNRNVTFLFNQQPVRLPVISPLLRYHTANTFFSLLTLFLPPSSLIAARSRKRCQG